MYMCMRIFICMYVYVYIFLYVCVYVLHVVMHVMYWLMVYTGSMFDFQCSDWGSNPERDLKFHNDSNYTIMRHLWRVSEMKTICSLFIQAM